MQIVWTYYNQRISRACVKQAVAVSQLNWLRIFSIADLALLYKRRFLPHRVNINFFELLFLQKHTFDLISKHCETIPACSVSLQSAVLGVVVLFLNFFVFTVHGVCYSEGVRIQREFLTFTVYFVVGSLFLELVFLQFLK